MNKKTIVQLAIIITALVLGIFSIQYFLSSMMSLVAYGLLSGASFGEGYFIPSLTNSLATFVQLALCWWLIKRSTDVANFICEQASFGQSLKVDSKPIDLLFILLVVLGIYFLISDLPAFIKAIIGAFRSKAPHNSFNFSEEQRPVDWLRLFITLLLPIVLLMFAKPISVYFAKDLSEEEIVITDAPGETHYLHHPEE